MMMNMMAVQDALPVDMEGRELEAQVLHKAAAMLEDVRGHWGENGFYSDLDSALKYNQNLWTLFQAEVLEGEGRLPMDIRNNILSLSAFVDKRTFEVMAYPAPEKLDILININRNLAEGLLAH